MDSNNKRLMFWMVWGMAGFFFYEHLKYGKFQEGGWF
jgi:hypothetical protein